MSSWRKIAIDLLPAQKRLVECAANPMALWIELLDVFRDAHARHDWVTVKAIYVYGSWCISSASGPLPNDSSTAATCAFYEHVPTIPSALADMPRWVRAADFRTLRPHLEYHVGKDAIDAIAARFA